MSTEIMNAHEDLQDSTVYLIRALSKDSGIRYFAINQLDKPTWVPNINESMEFDDYAEAEAYVLEEIIKSPDTVIGEDGSLSITLPSILNADIKPLTIKIQEIRTTHSIMDSESLNTIKESFREVMEVLESALSPFREMVEENTNS